MSALQNAGDNSLPSILPPQTTEQIGFPDEQDESGASNHSKTSRYSSSEYTYELEDSSLDEDDYNFTSLDDDGNQESFDTIGSGGSFELVFQGIDSVEDVTFEYIESCNSLVDMEQISKVLAKDSSKNNDLLNATSTRLLILREQEFRKKNGGNDGIGDDFVVVTSNLKSMGISKEADIEITKARDMCSQKISSTSGSDSESAGTASLNAIADNKKAASTKPIYPDLTAKNLRSAIVFYSSEHPDDLGMPMKKLMKFYGIGKSTPPSLQNEFLQIVNQECLLETSDELGRVLFLKEDDEPCENLEKQYQELVDNEIRNYERIKIGIENCNSIHGLRSYIDELRRPNINLPDHLAAAEKRIKTISRKINRRLNLLTTIDNNNTDDEDVDFPSDQVPRNITSLTIEYIQNSRDIHELFEIVHYFGGSGQNGSLRYRYNGLYGAAIKRLSALGFETSKASREQDFKSLDSLLALSLHLEMNGTVRAPEEKLFTGIFRPRPPMQTSDVIGKNLGFSGFGAGRDNISHRIQLSPNFYHYDHSVSQLREFWDLSHHCPLRERWALDYIEQCNFIPELRGILHFSEEPRNYEFGQSLINSAETRIQTILDNDPLASINPDCYSFDSEKSKKWLVVDSDIQLTKGVQRFMYERDDVWQRGNGWLMNVFTETYDRLYHVYYDGDTTRLLRNKIFQTVFFRVKAEGRRFFRLCGNTHISRLIWVDYSHADVRDELVYIFKYVDARRITRSRHSRNGRRQNC